ncbi:MAG: hypothetical protein DWQ44_03100 [Bacteroidetes bacterium]|nr:MAG: hypothetical protein DWQ33_04705 [Bacteroidota bacterium]REK00011.1 MAG: hypothetical protein DWQ39_13975 [Bacteroidota bacterium]REK35810.1 MAG: hypothetical protein DWQ44_03100 [Bacteroidota bacterium]REK49319.1 MAG: hypothetical protein DWQ48_07755 [Bacteroidota bacterium]
MIKLNQSTLDKLEELLILGGYKVRTEKGNFKSGSCVVESSKLVVLNKFSTVEVKVSFLIEAIRSLDLDTSMMDEKYLKLLQDVKNTVPADQENLS